MLKWARLKFFHIAVLQKNPLFLSCAKDSQRENGWSLMTLKHSHSRIPLSDIFTVGWGTSVHISQGFYRAKVCESLWKGFLLEVELPPALPAELDFSGKLSRSHPGAGLPWPQPLPPSSSSSAAPGCLAGKADNIPTGRTGFFRQSAWMRVYMASPRWRVHN